MSENSEVLQRLTALETYLKSHADQDTKAFDRMGEMHKTHFERAQEQGEILRELMTSVKGLNEKSEEAKADIKKHVDDHRTFYVSIILSALGGFGALFFWMIQKVR